MDKTDFERAIATGALIGITDMIVALTQCRNPALTAEARDVIFEVYQQCYEKRTQERAVLDK